MICTFINCCYEPFTCALVQHLHVTLELQWLFSTYTPFNERISAIACTCIIKLWCMLEVWIAGKKHKSCLRCTCGHLWRLKCNMALLHVVIIYLPVITAFKLHSGNHCYHCFSPAGPCSGCWTYTKCHCQVHSSLYGSSQSRQRHHAFAVHRGNGHGI